MQFNQFEVTDQVLDFWLFHKMNVLLSGPHGTGKTTRFIEACQRNNLSYLYFSAATIDPWVDFVGIPRSVKCGNKEYLEFVQRKELAEGSVQVIIMDELNRSNPKVQNAVMELIQFKSINGRKFENLQCILAGINPFDEDGTYTVNKLDPALLDRFPIKVEVPRNPDSGYFTKKFGEKLAKEVISWWNDLEDKAKKLVSPRLLDEAVSYYLKKGDVAHILPLASNPKNLLDRISVRAQTLEEEMEEILKEKNTEKARKFLMNDNKYEASIHKIFENKKALAFFAPYLEHERVAMLLRESNRREKLIPLMICEKNTKQYVPLVKSLIDSQCSRIAVRLLAMEMERIWKLKKEGKKGGYAGWKHWFLDNCEKYVDSKGDKLLVEEAGDRILDANGKMVEYIEV